MKRNGNLKIIRCHTQAIIPEYPREGSSGLILRAKASDFIMPGGTVELPLGIKIQLPFNTFGLISESSFLAKQGVRCYRENIDEDFIDEVKVRLHNAGPIAWGFQRGTVVGYLTVVPYCRKKIEVVEEF